MLVISASVKKTYGNEQIWSAGSTNTNQSRINIMAVSTSALSKDVSRSTHDQPYIKDDIAGLYCKTGYYIIIPHKINLTHYYNIHIHTKYINQLIWYLIHTQNIHMLTNMNISKHIHPKWNMQNIFLYAVNIIILTYIHIYITQTISKNKYFLFSKNISALNKHT
jgi:hypothetical protein